ncbi:hypothetical protein R5R35_000896 [Gryllus longicercus]|uniref:O-acyltransferase WSD1 C-terminal domain-containing protein n=1 Tax=Gryllus longicercus TaxID=2509291 RepID=A0AAN9VQ43_9ORTH
MLPSWCSELCCAVAVGVAQGVQRRGWAESERGAERRRRAMEAAMEVVADAAVAMLAAVLLTALLPAALALALLMTIGRGVWLRWLERRHPELELERRTRVAAAMDSQRCQGLATALLALRGRLPRQRLLRALQEGVVERRGAAGELLHPHLRLALTSRWGRYAWRSPDAAFDLQRHVVEAPPTWRGRPVTPANLQEWMSAHAGKLQAAGHPPWQVTLLVADERTFVLARAHLALLAADALSLAALLPLEPAPSPPPPPPPTPPPPSPPPLLGEDDELPPQQVAAPEEAEPEPEEAWSWERWDPREDPSDAPCIPPPPPPMEALPALARHALRAARAALAALQALDPARGGADGATGGPLLGALALMVALVLVLVRAPGDPLGKRAAFLWAAPGACARALRPWALVRRAAAWAWALGVWAAAVAPLLLLREASLLLLATGAGAGGRRRSAAGAAAAASGAAGRLALGAAREATAIARTALAAPRAALLEIHSSCGQPLSELQAATLCGRRALAWSAPVAADTLRKARAGTGMGSGAGAFLGDEVALAALARALDVYFCAAALPRPDAVHATARVLSLSAALGRAPHRTAPWLCLALPTGAACEGWRRTARAAAAEAAAARRRSRGLRAAAAAAEAAAAALLPSALLRMALNALTRRYALDVTFLREDAPVAGGVECGGAWQRRTLCGCEVEEAFVWRPLQANISMAVCVSRGPRGLQLGVLADAQLTPAPAFLAAVFEQEVRRAAGDPSPPPLAAAPPPTPPPPRALTRAARHKAL